ncbi:TetR/AcrR family transcriptional regulator [Conexibacter arvalis]|uniref:AcrR family transcriptional regulator n=1 Tax=Conexibacter arvalis TaxID=912552 RepID=A0A840IHC4_9ACTN|nr:TetR/AcrR family transcriptional regulator [Conexibacter arvalis]MBB4664176.1 AcrR family transcriptional regulator [Conexibacter arvalis]
MAPPRKHSTDDILDAARALVLREGPRAASVAAISHASGAPVGTLYHRFGSRDGLLAAAWFRALERYQAVALAAVAAHSDDPVEAGVALAETVLAFAADQPEDARLLLAVRRSDLLDGDDGALRERLYRGNEPLEAALRQIARDRYGRADARALERVTRAVVDLPAAAVRRHVRGDGAPLPRWLAGDVAAAARALLRDGPSAGRRESLATPSRRSTSSRSSG